MPDYSLREMNFNAKGIIFPLSRPLGLLQYHLYTIWLVTLSDLKSIVLPETAFGIFSALSGSQMTTNDSPSLYIRLPSSICEDTVNKPWRAIPTKRLSAKEATRLLLGTIPACFLLMNWLGGQYEFMAMLALTWMYNDLGGGDDHYLIRNAINALGFACYSSGSTIVAAGYGSTQFNTKGNTWLVIVAGIIFSTLQMQDMADVKGDALRGRKTLPLLAGQEIARWSIALPVIFWSIFCPRYWDVSIWAYVLPVFVGIALAVRVTSLRTVTADQMTWKLWCIWTSILYLLPLCEDYSVFSSAF